MGKRVKRTDHAGVWKGQAVGNLNLMNAREDGSPCCTISLDDHKVFASLYIWTRLWLCSCDGSVFLRPRCPLIRSLYGITLTF
jgi:hypothetical protein